MLRVKVEVSILWGGEESVANLSGLGWGAVRDVE